jgi:hypothetical protein
MMKKKFVMLFFTLSPVILLIASVSSIGLFKLKRWGRVLANTAMILFLIIFSKLVVSQSFPTYFDSSIYAGSGWFIFYHLNLRFDTFVIPLVVLLFAVLINLKIFRKYYQT